MGAFCIQIEHPMKGLLVTGPLSDLRLVELGQLIAGPYCGQLMGDYGAEVIKIEDPKRGDPLRDWGQEKKGGHSLWWPIAARNKKCVTADLRSPEGQQIVKDLVAQSDMLLENFRPGTLERWGLGWDELKKINPGLIMIRVSGYGQTGPYAPRPGYASVGEAMGGIRYVIGEPDRMPARAGISLGDSLAATFATLGALAALHHKEKTGEGQVIDASIYESVLAYMESLVPEWEIAGYQRERTGAVLPKVSPSNVYPTKSGEMLLIAANMDTVFRRLAKAMGKPELADDPKYATHIARGENTADLDSMIAKWSSTWEVHELMEHLIAEEVPHGLVYTAKDMLVDPQYLARESITNVDVPGIGAFPMQNIFPLFSETKPTIRWSGPTLGEHTDEVYRELLGYDDSKMADLKARGIIK